MKNRILALTALLALLASAAIAAPARLHLVVPRDLGTDTDATPNGLCVKRTLADYTAALDAFGILWDQVDPWDLPTKDAYTGKYFYGASGQFTTHEVVWHTNWWKSQDYVNDTPASGGETGCNRDSLTRYAMWDGAAGRPTQAERVIQIISGPTGVNIGRSDIFANSATCSTGVSGYTLEFKFAPNRPQAAMRVNYLQGTDINWHTGGQSGEYSQPVALASGMPGIVRNVVGQRQNVTSNSADGPPTVRTVNCDDCDSLLSPAGGLPDSSVLWARYRGPTDRAPVIFNNPAAGYFGGGGSIDCAAVVAALCMADSLLGNRLIGQRAGWQPIEAAAYLSGTFQRNQWNQTPQSGQSRGLMLNVPASEVDSTRYKGTVRDSLRKLGIKYTFAMNPDSVRAYLGELNWYKDLPNVKFMPTSITGLFTGTGSSMGRASKYHLPDAFGRNRVRSVGWYGQPCLNATDDTTTVCMVKWAFERTDSIVPGKTCYALYQPSDYIGNQIGINGVGARAQESWVGAMWYAGVRTVIMEVDDQNWMPGTGSAINGVGAPIAATDWYGYIGTKRRVVVYADSSRVGGPLGTMAFVTTQLNSGENATWNMDVGHGYGSDFLNGLIFNLRSQSDIRFYYHQYRSTNNVYRIDAGSLAGTSATGWPRRWGWWKLKDAVNPTRAWSRLAGREVVKWVYVDEL